MNSIQNLIEQAKSEKELLQIRWDIIKYNIDGRISETEKQILWAVLAVKSRRLVNAKPITNRLLVH